MRPAASRLAGLLGIGSLLVSLSSVPSLRAGAAPHPRGISLPLHFERNDGQADPRYPFLARGPGYTALLGPAEAVIGLAGPDAQSPRTFALRFGGVHDPQARTPAGRVEGLERLPGRVSYLLGDDPRDWHAGVPTFARVRSRQIYPGIDLLYHAAEGRLEYDFQVAPGADPGAIRVEVDGADALRVAPNGDLLLTAGDRELRQQRPVAYQELHGRRLPIPCSYRLGYGTTKDTKDTKGGKVGQDRTFANNPTDLHPAHPVHTVAPPTPYTLHPTPTEVSFEVGPYDKTRPLTIDPVLVYSTYLGGSADDTAFRAAADGAGNLYVSGGTVSNDFPTQSPLQGTRRGNYDAVLAKLDPTGSQLLAATYLGGTASDYGSALGFDGKGNLYWSVGTLSSDFPTTVGAPDRTFNGNQDVALLKLTPGLDQLVFSTYLGGSGFEFPYGLAVDPQERVWLTGETDSTNLPVTPTAPQQARLGPSDGWIARYDPGTNLTLGVCTYYGGKNGESVRRLALDLDGGVYVTGTTSSADFPTSAGAIRRTFDGLADVYLLKLAATGDQFVYGTYLGGTKPDYGQDVAVDTTGSIYVCGSTESTDFPGTVDGAQPAHAGGAGDAFVLRLDPGGATQSYATYFGGKGDDRFFALGVDRAGNVYATGITSSPDLPVSANALQSMPAGGTFDSLLVRLSAKGSRLLYVTYLGGTGDDTGSPVIVGPDGSVFVTGTATPGFPLSDTPFQKTPRSSVEAFAMRFRFPARTPLNLQATATGNFVDLTWTPDGLDAEEFRIERGQGEQSPAPRANVTGDTTQFRDVSVTLETPYAYRISATSSGEVSAPTLPVLITPLRGPGSLAAAPLPAAVELTWSDESAFETGYEVERRAGEEPFARVTQLPPGTTRYTDGGLAEGASFAYRVRATGERAVSAYSPEATGTAGLQPPTGIVAEVGGTQITVSWADHSAVEEGFRIERRQGTGGFQEIATTGMDETVYTDRGLAPGNTYTYRVRAYKGDLRSPYSDEAPGTILPPVGGTVSVPSILSFRDVKRNTRATKPLLIRNTSATEELRVTPAAPAAPFGVPNRTPLSIPPGGSASLNVTFKPPKKRTYKGTLTLTTTDPRRRSVKVRLAGTVK